MPGPGELIDFVPAPSEALGIAGALDLRERTIANQNPESFGADGITSRSADDLTQIQIRINELNAGIVAAVTQAFQNASCPLPSLPPPAQPPDLTDCVQALDKLKDEALTQLGHLDDVFTIFFNVNNIPNRITSP